MSPGTALYLGKALVADADKRQAEEALASKRVTGRGGLGGINCLQGRLQRGCEA